MPRSCQKVSQENGQVFKIERISWDIPKKAQNQKSQNTRNANPKTKKCWEGSSFLAQASSDMSAQKSAKNRKNKKVHQSNSSKLAETSEKNGKQEAEKLKMYGNVKKVVFEGRIGRNGHLWPTQKKICEEVPKNTQKQQKNHNHFFEGRIGRNGHLRTMHSQI